MTRLAILAGAVVILGGCDRPLSPDAVVGDPNLLSVANASMIEIGPAEPGTGALDISETGQIIGAMYSPEGDYRAFAWMDGVTRDLRDFYVAGLNDRGAIAGTCPPRLTNGAQQACYMMGIGSPLQRIPWGPSARATDVNNNDQVLGSVCDAQWRCRAAIHDIASNTTRYLGSIDAHPVAFNDRGDAVGTFLGPDGRDRVVVWRGESEHDLGTLGGTSAFPYDINEAGHVLIAVETGARTYCYPNGACYYEREVTTKVWQDGVVTEIGTLGGAAMIGSALNDAGQVVGAAIDANGDVVAFHWHDGVLSTFARQTASITGMNDRGEVVGSIDTPDGTRAVRWTLTLSSPTAADALEDVTSRISTLVADGRLTASAGEALLTKVRTASKHLGASRLTASANAMRAFMHQVDALVRSGRLTAADGAALNSLAQTAIGRMSS